METPNLPKLSEIEIALARDRLRWLKIGYYVSGVMTVLFSCIFLIHFTICACFAIFGFPENHPKQPPLPVTQSHEDYSKQTANQPAPPEEQDSQDHPEGHKNAGPPRIIFGIIAAAIGVIILIGWTLGGATIYAGYSISQRKNKVLIQVIAAISCIFIPTGTLLGVLTFLAFSTPGVKAEFA